MLIRIPANLMSMVGLIYKVIVGSFLLSTMISSGVIVL